jgi:hypothetical protein
MLPYLISRTAFRWRAQLQTPYRCQTSQALLPVGLGPGMDGNEQSPIKAIDPALKTRP